MPSKLPHPREAFVWTWLPDATDPVVAGRLVPDGQRIQFVYGRSYRERADALPLYLSELPIRPELIAPRATLTMPSAIRDGAPDAWGRRVILNKTLVVATRRFESLLADPTAQHILLLV